MSFTITESFVQQYRSNLMLLSQQKGSRLRRAVRTETVTGKSAFFERLAATAAVPRTTRHGDTPLVAQVHSRRMVTLADYEWADLIDQADKVKLLIEPTSDYTVNATNAMGRAMDDVVIAAANGNAFAGETGQTPVPLPAGQKIAVGAAGLTLAKLLSAKEILDAAEVDPEEPRYCILKAKQVTDLLNTTEVKSADYNTVKALAQGQLNTFLGYEFIRTQRITEDGSGDDLVLVCSRRSLVLAIGEEVVTDIGPRRDKSLSTQVYVRMSIGATRVEDESVVQIACL